MGFAFARRALRSRNCGLNVATVMAEYFYYELLVRCVEYNSDNCYDSI